MKTLSELHALLLETYTYDPITGDFIWRLERKDWGEKAQRRKSRIGTKSGSLELSQGRVFVRFNGRQYLAHRLAWFYMHGEWPPRGIDHKDGVPSHNWWSNLRLATKSENGQNVRRARCSSKSGVLGVHWSKRFNKWVVDLTLDGKRVHCSYHRELSDAITAHAIAKAKWHPFRAVVTEELPC